MEIVNPYGFIYITTNMINGKKYIGQRKFSKGWQHYLGSGTIFRRAIKKYSKENFYRDIVVIAYSKEELDMLEIEFIQLHNAVNSDEYYNIALGGNSGNMCAGKTEEEMEEIYKKISEARKGYNPSIETRLKISRATSGENNPFYGKNHSNEAKKKISESHKGQITWNKGKEFPQISGEKNPMYGKHHTEETKQKISESHKGKYSGKNNPKAKTIICVTTGKVFHCIKDGAKFYDCNAQSISLCCRGKYKSAGKLPNDIPLVWMYYEEYLTLQKIS